MRLIESVCAVTVFAVFLGIAASAVRPLRRLHDRTQSIARQYERDRFIVRSFTSLCAGGSHDRFSEWQEMCESLWKFESFSIKEVGRDRDQNAIFLCAWKTADGETAVWAICKKGANA